MRWQFPNFTVESDDPVAAVKQAAGLLWAEWEQTHGPEDVSGYMADPFGLRGQVPIEAVEYGNAEIARVFNLPPRDMGLPVTPSTGIAAGITGGNTPLLVAGALILGWLLFVRKK